MEEYKFRVWDNDKKQMIYLSNLITDSRYYLQINNHSWGLFKEGGDEAAICNKLFGDTLMQYTGECVPSCGEMIYDGDILEQSYVSPLSGERVVKRYLIYFKDGCYKAKCIGHSPYGDTYLHFVLANGGVFEIRIIGDKFNNPELLEG